MHSLVGLLDPTDVITDPTAMAPYLTDWRGRFTGAAAAVARPRTTDAVATILRWATQTGTPVVP
jgi:FAD/FMN-containing dehydrogenase